jgi:hypothetical protein
MHWDQLKRREFITLLGGDSAARRRGDRMMKRREVITLLSGAAAWRGGRAAAGQAGDWFSQQRIARHLLASRARLSPVAAKSP